jgi:hypothetical protein
VEDYFDIRGIYRLEGVCTILALAIVDILTLGDEIADL